MTEMRETERTSTVSLEDLLTTYRVLMRVLQSPTMPTADYVMFRDVCREIAASIVRREHGA